MENLFTLHNILGAILTITGIFDAIKYHWQAKSIRKVGLAKGHSRKFINVAILNDLTRLFYFIFIKQDIFLLISSIVALVCMFELYWVIYWFYPYRMRGCSNFKRPNTFIYFINSLLPNKIRKRL
jgi:hypothetical protein